MEEIKWIKIVTGIFNNRKMKQIENMPESHAITIMWFKLLCLAGDSNSGGLLLLSQDVPYTEEMFANEFRLPINTVKLAIAVFTQFNMIEKINNVFAICNWEKYQNIESMDNVREKNRLRKQKQRERQKQLSGSISSKKLPDVTKKSRDMSRDMSRDGHVTSQESHATELELELEVDTSELLQTKELTTVRAREVLMINLKDEILNKINLDYFEVCKKDGWLDLANEIIDTVVEFSFGEKSYCFNQKSFTADDFKQLALELTTDDLFTIGRSVKWKEDIVNRKIYILGVLINVIEARKKPTPRNH